MGRTPHIQVGAKPTTIYLTKVQKAAIRKFQAKRLEKNEADLGLTEVLLEGLRRLLDNEGWLSAELETLFPKLEVKRAKISPFPKGRSSHRSTT
jgi:hypothetical protein